MDIDKIQPEVVEVDASEFPKGLTYLILGEAKVGKTTFGINFAKDISKVLLLDLENGSKLFPGTIRLNIGSINSPTRPRYDTRGVPVIDSNGKTIHEKIPFTERGFFRNGKPAPVYSMAEAIKYIDDSYAEMRWETVVLDTVDDLNIMAESDVCDAIGTTAMGADGQYGKDWNEAKMKVVKLLKRVQSTCQKREINFVILSHVKNASTTDPEDSKKQVSSIVPDLPSGLRKQAQAVADVVGYAHKNRKGERLVSFKAVEQNVIGSRLAAFADKILPLSYTELLAEFNRVNNPTKPEPITQVETI